MKKSEAISSGYKYSPGGRDMRDRLRGSWGDPDQEALENLERMTAKELFDAWLDYEGIIGYTDLVIHRLRECGFVVEEVER